MKDNWTLRISPVSHSAGVNHRSINVYFSFGPGLWGVWMIKSKPINMEKTGVNNEDQSSKTINFQNFSP